jgi:outer membrane protein TolC
VNLTNGPQPDNTLVRRRALAMAATLATLLAVAAHAQSTVPLTLAETEDLAFVAEPGQQILRAQAAAFASRADVASALPDPTLRLGVDNFPLQSGGFSTEGMTNAGIGLRQEFPAGKTRAFDEKRFDFLASAFNDNADARGRNVLTSVRAAWLDIYYWSLAHELVADSRPYFADLATVTRSLYAVGRKSQPDVLRAELELGRLDDRLIEIERQRAGAQAALSEWIGQDAARPVAMTLPGWSHVPEQAELGLALQQHPALKAVQMEVAARDAGVGLARQRSKPAWALDVAYKYRDGYLSPGEPRSDFVSVNVTVGLPFFRKRSVDSTLTAALHERSAAEAGSEQVLREMQSGLVASYADWRELTRRLELYESQILDLARNNAEASLLAYQSDRGDFADVMRAYVDDLNSRIEYVHLQVKRAQTYAVLANLGGLQ